MATPVEMPQLGNTVEECVLTRWLKKENDPVAAGDLVAEIETDKTTFEIASPVDGTLLAILVEEGAIVPVFTNIFVVGTPGERIDQFRTARRKSSNASPPASPQVPDFADRSAAPSVRRTVERPDDRARPSSNPAAFSPRASRLAARLGLHPDAIKGSGPGGRVLESDIRRAHDALTREAPAKNAVITSINERGRAPHRITGLRATIARRMRESLSSTAQYTLNTSADATGLLALRERVKARASEGAPDITINDLITFCTIQALLEVPALNAEFIEGEIVVHAEVHIAFAVDTPRGLLAPVVRNAHDLTIRELSLRMKQLTRQALDGTISPDGLTGATFTISNLGSLGVESFTPLINPPQVAILGVDAITLKAVRRQRPRAPLRLRETSARRAAAFAESIEFVDAIGLSLTCDHQAVDGAPGARFLQVVRQKIESVEALVEI